MNGSPATFSLPSEFEVLRPSYRMNEDKNAIEIYTVVTVVSKSQ